VDAETDGDHDDDADEEDEAAHPPTLSAAPAGEHRPDG